MKGKKLEAPEENPGTRKLIGVFTAPPPGCIGEPFNDRMIVDPRHKGKGVSSGRYRADGRTDVCAPGTFKLSPFLFANEDMKGKDPYKTNIRYKDVFKVRDPKLIQLPSTHTAEGPWQLWPQPQAPNPEPYTRTEIEGPKARPRADSDLRTSPRYLLSPNPKP